MLLCELGWLINSHKFSSISSFRRVGFFFILVIHNIIFIIIIATILPLSLLSYVKENCSEWCTVGDGMVALWDLWDWFGEGNCHSYNDIRRDADPICTHSDRCLTKRACEVWKEWDSGLDIKALKFDRHFNSCAAKMPVKQSDATIKTPNTCMSASRLHKIWQ